MQTRVSWEVSLGETGKVLTLRSSTVIQNRTQVPVEAAIVHRNRSISVLGTVPPSGTYAVPANLPPPAGLAFRPSFGEGTLGMLHTCTCVITRTVCAGDDGVLRSALVDTSPYRFSEPLPLDAVPQVKASQAVACHMTDGPTWHCLAG